MEAITYSLKLDNINSEHYYRDVRKFADEVLLYADNSIIPIVKEYIEYLSTYNLEEIREQEEYILELLSFAILWQAYGRYALKVRFAPFVTLSQMGEWRKKHQQLKPVIDFLRGVLITLVLLPGRPKKNLTSPPTILDIDRVCLWFEATGEFREQALRFIRWRAYWGTLDDKTLSNIFKSIAEFNEWFAKRSIEVLGKYTENVEGFLFSTIKKYRWREDRISCTRSRQEYHLNMVGAELMNRAFQKDYLKTDTKALLLPGCMRAHNDENCKAEKEKKGLRCRDCEPKCRVNQLRIMGLKKRFDVYVIPHASDLSLWSPQKGKQRCGVIASACVTTLVEGGWELKRYGVPAQCVLLDCSGCKKHWRKDGISTELNIRELKRVLA